MSEATYAPDALVAEATDAVRADDEQGLVRIDQILARYDDPRLHFLRGSVLAGLKRYGEAMVAIGRAVELDPDNALSRFQLGFLLFTSGHAVPAYEVWAPLRQLDKDNPIAFFVQGLEHLGRGEFSEAARFLREGMALNPPNAPLVANMQLLVEAIENRAAHEPSPQGVSATHLLLQRYDDDARRQ